jgi:hypothetical protein
VGFEFGNEPRSPDLSHRRVPVSSDRWEGMNATIAGLAGRRRFHRSKSPRTSINRVALFAALLERRGPSGWPRRPPTSDSCPTKPFRICRRGRVTTSFGSRGGNGKPPEQVANASSRLKITTVRTFGFLLAPHAFSGYFLCRNAAELFHNRYPKSIAWPAVFVANNPQTEVATQE